jgi:hypothetical protein
MVLHLCSLSLVGEETHSEDSFGAAAASIDACYARMPTLLG